MTDGRLSTDERPAYRRPLVARVVEFALIVDFIVFEAIRRAPGDYNTADIA